MHSLFSFINNASLSNLGDFSIPTTKKSLKVLELLYREGLIRGYLHNKTRTTVYIKFTGNSRKPVIKHIQAISTSGRKVFVSTRILANLVHLKESFLISTPKGLLTAQEALESNTGGLVICKILS